MKKSLSLFLSLQIVLYLLIINVSVHLISSSSLRLTFDKSSKLQLDNKKTGLKNLLKGTLYNIEQKENDINNTVLKDNSNRKAFVGVSEDSTQKQKRNIKETKYCNQCSDSCLKCKRINPSLGISSYLNKVPILQNQYKCIQCKPNYFLDQDYMCKTVCPDYKDLSGKFIRQFGDNISGQCVELNETTIKQVTSNWSEVEYYKRIKAESYVDSKNIAELYDNTSQEEQSVLYSFNYMYTKKSCLHSCEFEPKKKHISLGIDTEECSCAGDCINKGNCCEDYLEHCFIFDAQRQLGKGSCNNSSSKNSCKINYCAYCLVNGEVCLQCANGFKFKENACVKHCNEEVDVKNSKNTAYRIKNNEVEVKPIDKEKSSVINIQIFGSSQKNDDNNQEANQNEEEDTKKLNKEKYSEISGSNICLRETACGVTTCEVCEENKEVVYDNNLQELKLDISNNTTRQKKDRYCKICRTGFYNYKGICLINCPVGYRAIKSKRECRKVSEINLMSFLESKETSSSDDKNNNTCKKDLLFSITNKESLIFAISMLPSLNTCTNFCGKDKHQILLLSQNSSSKADYHFNNIKNQGRLSPRKEGSTFNEERINCSCDVECLRRGDCCLSFFHECLEEAASEKCGKTCQNCAGGRCIQCRKNSSLNSSNRYSDIDNIDKTLKEDYCECNKGYFYDNREDSCIPDRIEEAKEQERTSILENVTEEMPDKKEISQSSEQSINTEDKDNNINNVHNFILPNNSSNSNNINSEHNLVDIKGIKDSFTIHNIGEKDSSVIAPHNSYDNSPNEEITSRENSPESQEHIPDKDGVYIIGNINFDRLEDNDAPEVKNEVVKNENSYNNETNVEYTENSGNKIKGNSLKKLSNFFRAHNGYQSINSQGAPAGHNAQSDLHRNNTISNIGNNDCLSLQSKETTEKRNQEINVKQGNSDDLNYIIKVHPQIISKRQDSNINKEKDSIDEISKGISTSYLRNLSNNIKYANNTLLEGNSSDVLKDQMARRLLPISDKHNSGKLEKTTDYLSKYKYNVINSRNIDNGDNDFENLSFFNNKGKNSGITKDQQVIGLDNTNQIRNINDTTSDSKQSIQKSNPSKVIYLPLDDIRISGRQTLNIKSPNTTNSSSSKFESSPNNTNAKVKNETNPSFNNTYLQGLLKNMVQDYMIQISKKNPSKNSTETISGIEKEVSSKSNSDQATPLNQNKSKIINAKLVLNASEFITPNNLTNITSDVSVGETEPLSSSITQDKNNAYNITTESNTTVLRKDDLDLLNSLMKNHSNLLYKLHDAINDIRNMTKQCVGDKNPQLNGFNQKNNSKSNSSPHESPNSYSINNTYPKDNSKDNENLNTKYINSIPSSSRNKNPNIFIPSEYDYITEHIPVKKILIDLPESEEYGPLYHNSFIDDTLFHKQTPGNNQDFLTDKLENKINETIKAFKNPTTSDHNISELPNHNTNTEKFNHPIQRNKQLLDKIRKMYNDIKGEIKDQEAEEEQLNSHKEKERDFDTPEYKEDFLFSPKQSNNLKDLKDILSQAENTPLKSGEDSIKTKINSLINDLQNKETKQNNNKNHDEIVNKLKRILENNDIINKPIKDSIKDPSNNNNDFLDKKGNKNDKAVSPLTSNNEKEQKCRDNELSKEKEESIKLGLIRKLLSKRLTGTQGSSKSTHSEEKNKLSLFDSKSMKKLSLRRSK
mmetsp:Transcript_41506/g.43438  ORF Transcript_41506/g.43438 Transcript_41506/m.43438 type:complete len:1686 (-) Transcript_41506:45-5102(-)